MCCRNERGSAFGFTFCFKENYNPDYKPKINPNSRAVICLSTKIIYMTLSSSPNHNNIRSCLKRKGYKYDNKYWYYLDEFFELNTTTDQLIKEIIKKRELSSTKKKIKDLDTNEVFESIDSYCKRYKLCHSDIVLSLHKTHKPVKGHRFALV